jgi:phage shock protein PspC (stress-responsive transcriptional regulator)
VKKLYKISQGKMICGVCNGIAAYFNVDVNLVRIGTVILACCSGVGLAAYIVAAIILPEA